jgi:hypothetical protein
MDFLKQTRSIERLDFFNGQRLFAEDLQGLDAFNREMRWLHNQSLHQPGVGNGFAVTGKKGDREVQIGPGYAIDAEGREIVSIEDRVEPVPPVAGEADGTPRLYDLTVAYGEELEEAEQREGICSPQGTVRLKEEPVFCWVELDSNGQPRDFDVKKAVLAGMRLVLARAEVLNCQLEKDLSIAQRLSARPATQPYICCETDSPDWEPLIFAPLDPAATLEGDTAKDLRTFLQVLAFFPFILPIGLKAVIDTTTCGFRTTPCYSARIAGPRIRHHTFTNAFGTNESLDVSLVLEGIIQVVDPKPDQFTANVLLIAQLLVPEPETSGLVTSVVANLAKAKPEDFMPRLQSAVDSLFKYSRNPDTNEEKGWQLCWMGVEE